MKILRFTTNSGEPCAVRADLIKQVDPGTALSESLGYAKVGGASIWTGMERLEVRETAEEVISAWMAAVAEEAGG